MAERIKIPREQMGPIRRAFDTGGKWNTRADAVLIPIAYVAWGAAAAALAAVNLMAGAHIRKEYIQKVPAKKMKPGVEYKLAA